MAKRGNILIKLKLKTDEKTKSFNVAYEHLTKSFFWKWGVKVSRAKSAIGFFLYNIYRSTNAAWKKKQLLWLSTFQRVVGRNKTSGRVTTLSSKSAIMFLCIVGAKNRRTRSVMFIWNYKQKKNLRCQEKSSALLDLCVFGFPWSNKTVLASTFLS